MSIFHIQNPSGQPIGGAILVGMGATGATWSGTTNACGDFPAELADNPYNQLVITAPGYKKRTLPDVAVPAPLIFGIDCRVITLQLETNRPLPVTQPPLPPFDASDGEGQVHTTPPPELVIPTAYDPLFMRADFAGITLDANRWGGHRIFVDTFKVGANTTPYEMLMSPMLIMYPRRLQDAWLTESAERNYSHVVIASDGWNMAENGFAYTPQQIVDWAKYLQSWGNYVVYWGRLVADDPYLRALLDAHAVDFHILGEEVDTKCTAEQYGAMLDSALAISGGSIPHAAHFTSNYPEGFPRDTFLTNWDKYDGKVHLCWQANQNDSAGKQGAMLYYARQRVNLGLVGGNGRPAPNSRVYAFETMATAQLFGHCDEAYGNLRTLELMYCTRLPDQSGIRPVAGYGNGGRLPSGASL